MDESNTCLTLDFRDFMYCESILQKVNYLHWCEVHLCRVLSSACAASASAAKLLKLPGNGLRNYEPHAAPPTFSSGSFVRDPILVGARGSGSETKRIGKQTSCKVHKVDGRS